MYKHSHEPAKIICHNIQDSNKWSPNSSQNSNCPFNTLQSDSIDRMKGGVQGAKVSSTNFRSTNPMMDTFDNGMKIRISFANMVSGGAGRAVNE